MMLCEFINNYQEKLLISKKPDNPIDEDILTNE